jgi:cation transport ATPase
VGDLARIALETLAAADTVVLDRTGTVTRSTPEVRVETVRIARRTHRMILQNFAGTLVVDGAGILLAALGHLNPLQSSRGR